MAKYMKTEQGYIDIPGFALAPFKPTGKSYLMFSSLNSFTLAVNDKTKHWDGTLEYFAPDKIWTTWDGTTILSSVYNDGEHVLYLRGTRNKVITGSHSNYRWVLTGSDISCNGNIENLLDYATVESGKHPTMANYCYSYMFHRCTSLTQAPALPATTLSNQCYSNMFQSCTSLTQAPALPATTLATQCYQSMFSNCAALTQAPALPATTLANYCYSSMFQNCTSLTQAPALPATTLANYCYYFMFQSCTSLTQAPALPATTLSDQCYQSMFQNCISLKLSSTQTGEYTQKYRIPSSGDGITAYSALFKMFTSTGGTFTGTPDINTTYYLSSDNMIVRETEVATLNGYVGSMINNAVPTPDTTLSIAGKSADAKATGDALRSLSDDIANLPSGGSGLTTAQVNALDGMLKVCAFIKSDISAEYNAFRTAFGIEAATITGISATYSGGSVPAGTALSDLTGIVVTATYSDGSTATVTGYTLSGEIAEGSNTITVTYQGKTATFVVTGTAVAQTYTVTNNLTNVTNSNSATTASGYYSATLSVENGYTISVVITMGGVDITGSSYTEDGTILITEVTGDIVITATAELSSAYTVLYQLSDTPKSVSGLSEDTGITFGAEGANGYTKALTICVAYTGFDANETLMKMSSGRAVEITTNAGGSNTQIRVTSCSNAVTVNPEISDSGDYRVIITKEATSVKTLNIHTLSSGAVATAENVGTYGNFSHSACAGNLIVGDSDITVNKLVIYEGILSDAHIATFLSGGEV